MPLLEELLKAESVGEPALREYAGLLRQKMTVDDDFWFPWI